MAIKNITEDVLLSQVVGVPIGNQEADIMFDLNQFFIEYNRDATPVNTYYPILQKRMPGKLSNVEISGTMRTNYVGVPKSSSSHGYSFIQVGKQSTGIANAIGGYGIAWKPLTAPATGQLSYTIEEVRHTGSGSYSIKLSVLTPTGGLKGKMGYLRIPYRETGGHIFVPVQFGEYAGDLLYENCLIGNEELMAYAMESEELYVYMTKPNVYVVDFASTINDIRTWDEMDDEMGFLSFITCGVADIRANIKYDFKMTIGENSGLVFTLSTGEEELFSLSTGVRIPLYEMSGAEDADSIGISVYGTGGRKWYYDNIRIADNSPSFPYLYCSFSREGRRDEVYVRATTRGYHETETGGVKIYIATSEGEWELIGGHQSIAMQTISSDVIDLNDHIYRNRVHVIIMATHSGSALGNSTIEIDDISIENNESISVPIGGCIDAYIESDTIEEEFAFTTDADTGGIQIDNSIYGIVYIKELVRNGVNMIQGIDYTFIANEYTLTARGEINILTPYPMEDVVISAITDRKSVV